MQQLQRAFSRNKSYKLKYDGYRCKLNLADLLERKLQTVQLVQLIKFLIYTLFLYLHIVHLIDIATAICSYWFQAGTQHEYYDHFYDIVLLHRIWAASPSIQAYSIIRSTDYFALN